MLESERNKDRRRFYGLRVGDIVNAIAVDGTVHFESVEVVEYGALDNNRVFIKVNSDPETVIPWVAEWCDLITMVEDRK